MPQGYGYGNTRLRAMRSRLLTEADYHRLLAKENIQEVISALAETPYKEDIDAALVRFKGVACIFEALRSNLLYTLQQIQTFFEDEPAVLVDLLLRRWDRHNLLAILRGQTQEVPPERILAALIPVGRLDQVALRELARQPSVPATIDLMVTWRLPYATTLRQIQARTGAGPELDQLELALNRVHYATLRATLGMGNGSRAILREHLEHEIDLLNLGTILRLAGRPGLMPLIRRRYRTDDVRPLLIEPGGQLSPKRLAALAAEESGIEGVVRALSQTRYGPALAAGWQRYQAEAGRLAGLERELERWQARQMASMFRWNPLSLAIPIAYTGCKETEIANLRLIAHAIGLGASREGVLNDLIIV